MSKSYLAYLIMPVNFSRTDLGPTHIISAEAILAITFVTCHKEKNKLKHDHNWISLKFGPKCNKQPLLHCDAFHKLRA